jgi:hypothetical protein
LTLSSKLFAFCLAVAVIAAALADPVVEFASNAGWFGPGIYTDHSNLDVLPAFALGVVMLALYVIGKGRALLDGRALPRRIWTLVPFVFFLQMLALFVMETLEQLVIGGRILGPAIWLGAPVFASVAIHAAFCVGATYWVARSSRKLAATTLQLIRLIRAISIRAIAVPELSAPRCSDERSPHTPTPVRCRIGERAPPALLA